MAPNAGEDGRAAARSGRQAASTRKSSRSTYQSWQQASDRTRPPRASVRRRVPRFTVCSRRVRISSHLRARPDPLECGAKIGAKNPESAIAGVVQCRTAASQAAYEGFDSLPSAPTLSSIRPKSFADAEQAAPLMLGVGSLDQPQRPSVVRRAAGAQKLSDAQVSATCPPQEAFSERSTNILNLGRTILAYAVGRCRRGDRVTAREGFLYTFFTFSPERDP